VGELLSEGLAVSRGADLRAMGAKWMARRVAGRRRF
jgi:hypothetical protein